MTKIVNKVEVPWSTEDLAQLAIDDVQGPIRQAEDEAGRVRRTGWVANIPPGPVSNAELRDKINLILRYIRQET